MKTTLQIEKPGQCHNYAIFIASKYFKTIEDFINLEIAVKRFRGNMEKFHYNPIPMTKEIIHFFPNIETLIIYRKRDELLEGRRINKYCILYPITCNKRKEMIEEKGEGRIECEKLIYTKKDLCQYVNEEKERRKIQGMKEDEEIDYIIPEEVKKIEQGLCFNDARSIQFPTKLKRISSIYISGKSIKELNIPPGIESIGKIYVYDKSLTRITIPTSVSKIYDYCFCKNYYVKSIELSNGIQELGKNIFSDCHDLQEINIPTTVTSIGNECFDNCRCLLQKIDIPTSVKEIGDKVFSNCWKLRQINIPTTVTKIGNECFDDCTSLEIIEIPLKENEYIIGNNIYRIENNEMYSYIKSIKIEMINGEKVYPSKRITIPTNVTKINKYCFSHQEYLEEITIPTSVNILEDGCFSNCTSLTSITIPTSVTSIPMFCFSFCKSLPSITIPKSVTSIQMFCFPCCDSLTTINLSPNVKYLGGRCFSRCRSLKRITLPKSFSKKSLDWFGLNTSVEKIYLN